MGTTMKDILLKGKGLAMVDNYIQMVRLIVESGKMTNTMGMVSMSPLVGLYTKGNTKRD